MKKNGEDWFVGLDPVSVDFIDALKNVFLNKWQVKKEVHFLLNDLTNINKNENETIDEFNAIYDNILQYIPISHKPTT